MAPDDVDPAEAARIAAVIARVPGWNGRAHVVGALAGGITNRNHVVEVGGERFVLRLPGADTDLLGIDRECERVSATRAAVLGFAPEVLGIFDGSLVTRFVTGSEMAMPEFERPETLDHIATILAAFHASSPLDHSFDAFAIPRLHGAAAVSRGVAIPAGYTALDLVIRDIEAAFATSPDPRCPCHNDLLRANFLRDGGRVWLLDWEYAGMNDRAFDLGNLAVNNGLSAPAEDHLIAAYYGEMTPRRGARVRLMKIVSDAREAMWAVVQQGISTIDFDYRSYAAEHFERSLGLASSPAFSTWLVEAAEPEADPRERRA